MKALAIALLAISVSVPAMARPDIPADLHHQPEKFCLVAGVISAGIMERVNVGYNPEYVYEEMNRIDHLQLRIYLNESVTLAQQFATHHAGPVPPKEFAKWNYQRCIRAMTPKAAETYEMVGGKLKKTS